MMTSAWPPFAPGALLIFAGCAAAQPAETLPVSDNDSTWRESERGILERHVQLTFPDRFVKAGESYFSPDDSKIIFQAVERPEGGESADEYYAMFVADVVRDAGGRIAGIDAVRRISPPGSANTCGWFHPTDPNVAIFASTIGPPSESSAPGYQRGSGRYRWMFPPEMKVVRCDLRTADGTADSLDVVVEMNDAYAAECSFSADGRHLVFCTLATNEGDLFVTDMQSGETTLVVQARGYDGGPFFSPEGRRICYRSDRAGNNLLQIFVGELAFNEQGSVVGLKREFQLTDNEHVNWCPFWHPSGRCLVYATSEVSPDHRNYEVFIIDADGGESIGGQGPSRYGTKKRRVTFADGFDGLPAFDSAGSVMMWTSQRGEDGSSQLWAADFVLPVDQPARNTVADTPKTTQITIEDPETGVIYIYDASTHRLSRYDPVTHKLTEVTDPAEIRRALKLHGEGGGPK